MTGFPSQFAILPMAFTTVVFTCLQPSLVEAAGSDGSPQSAIQLELAELVKELKIQIDKEGPGSVSNGEFGGPPGFA